MKFTNQGEELLMKVAMGIEEEGAVESMPKLEGRKMIMFLKPK